MRRWKHVLQRPFDTKPHIDQEHAMNTLAITDLPVADELDHHDMADVHGGMMKLPGQHNTGNLLMSPDGEPVSVYVDGLLINSVTSGYAPR
jgi:hypothetical protein